MTLPKEATVGPLDATGADRDALLVALKSQDARINKLEKVSGDHTIFRRLTSSASAAALFLGIVLTGITLYDIFSNKLPAEHVGVIAGFNQAVNAVASLEEAHVKSQMQSLNLGLRLAAAQPVAASQAVREAQAKASALQLALDSTLTPQILNNLSIAKAILRDMKPDDVGISQLIVLISAALTARDLLSAQTFADRAVKKPVGRADVTAFLHAEAERYAGKVWFAMNNAIEGRRAYQSALGALGADPTAAYTRAYYLGDMVAEEYQIGDCNDGAHDLHDFVTALKDPRLPIPERSQMVATMQEPFAQGARLGCPIPSGPDSLASN